MEQNKAERLNENVTEKMCSSDGNVVGEMCSPADADTCGDGGKTTQERYLKILDFRHFESFFRFDKDGSNRRKKTLSNGVDVSVVLDVVTGNTR